MDGVLGNEMTYNGNHLFHYTSLDSAIKIIISGILRFGEFSNMNDIAEVKRDLFVNCNKHLVESLLAKYRSISLTLDTSRSERGFAIDTLWGYYAEKGNGACLVFDKDKLFNTYYENLACDGLPDSLNVNYIGLFSNRVEFEGMTCDEVKKEIIKHIQDIFYIKDICWMHEKEVRLLTTKKENLSIDDALIGVILCSPNEANIETTESYRILDSLRTIRSFQIYRYTTINGEKTLLCGSETKWPIFGLDLMPVTNSL